MILKKKNPQGSENGFFQVTEIDGWCCGDKAKAIVCKYAAQLDTTITVSGIKVDSVDYFFPTPLDVNSPQGKEEFQKAFRRIVNDLGYIPEDLVFTEVANGKLNVYTDFAQLHFVEFIQFNYANHLSKRVAAVKTDCKIVGLRKADLCDVEWVTRFTQSTQANYLNVFVRPVNIIPGAVYSVTYNSATSIYSGDFSDSEGTVTIAGHTSKANVVNGVLAFSIGNAAVGVSGVNSFALSVALPDGSKCCEIANIDLYYDFDNTNTFVENPDNFNPGDLRDKFGNKVEIYGQPSFLTV